MNALTLVFARRERHRIRELKERLEKIVAAVDGFYDLLGPRNWVFHESLNMDVAESLLRETADAAEQKLIAFYSDPEALSFMIRQAVAVDELWRRIDLIERARDDYGAGRFYSTVLVLLAVMVGFVNDVETEQRRGLHTRTEKEMTPWDSVAGHHLGLARAHHTFTETFRKTSDAEVRELYPFVERARDPDPPSSRSGSFPRRRYGNAFESSDLIATRGRYFPLQRT